MQLIREYFSTIISACEPLWTDLDLLPKRVKLVHMTYMPTITALLYLFLKINSAFQKYGWPFKSSEFGHSLKQQQQQTLLFQFFPKVAKAFVPELTKVTFGHVAHVLKTEIMQVYSRKCSVHVRKTRSRRSFLEVSAKLQAR